MALLFRCGHKHFWQFCNCVEYFTDIVLIGLIEAPCKYQPSNHPITIEVGTRSIVITNKIYIEMLLWIFLCIITHSTQMTSIVMGAKVTKSSSVVSRLCVLVVVLLAELNNFTWLKNRVHLHFCKYMLCVYYTIQRYDVWQAHWFHSSVAFSSWKQKFGMNSNYYANTKL